MTLSPEILEAIQAYGKARASHLPVRATEHFDRLVSLIEEAIEDAVFDEHCAWAERD